MSRKELTPHQVSKGLSYVKKDPPFLARLKGTQEQEKKKLEKFPGYIDGQDDDDYDELEGAQVVELDAHGKEIHRAESQDSENEETEKKNEDESPAVDENGRILFRARKKADNPEPEANKKREKSSKPESQAKKKSKKSKVKLSFEGDE